ncbi:MAG TPA: NAD-dependent epimerase/dehydratase family protein, partial [Acidimicrobiales bacterium]|nr:NAD-dependent epimerase/dehydratase family protein [Acidimicrobiales bacterium]
MTINRSFTVPAPVAEVLSYHQHPGALPRLSPPWVPVRIEAQAEALDHGEAVLRFPGGVRWVARHTPSARPDEFVDQLVSLPLRWRHTHTFDAVGDTATRVSDRVDTPVPGRLLRQMFRYRQDQLVGDMAAHRLATTLLEQQGRSRRLTVAITGASGLVGSSLSALLSTGGHRVVHLVRRPAHGDAERQWEPERPAPELFDDVDVVVHLAGATIAGRFTARHKSLIAASRIGPTSRLANAMTSSMRPPSTLVTASAIGFYGAARGDEVLTESSRAGDDFLAGVVREWEDAATAARRGGIRVVQVRTGIVQSPRGG